MRYGLAKQGWCLAGDWLEEPGFEICASEIEIGHLQ